MSAERSVQTSYGPVSIESADLFWSKVNKDGPVPPHRTDLGPCWEWTAATTGGYGRFSIGRRMRQAHRLAYELLVGPIPKGKQIDHICRNRRCVNPKHHEAVSNRVNALRGMSPTAIAWRSRLCLRGHSMTPDNTYVRPDGDHICRICKIERDRTYRRRKRERATGAAL